MSKSITKHPKQPTFFDLLPPESVLDQLDNRVRRVVIDGEQWVSPLDLLQYHGNKVNPSLSWKRTLTFMNEKQGANLGSNNLLEHQFEGRGQRKTPIINLGGFMRFVQSVEVPEWEFIRNWQAELAENEIKTKKQRKLERQKDLLEKTWSDNHEAIERTQLQIDVIKSWQTLQATVKDIVDKPNYGQLTNTEYLNLFGATANELKTKLNSKDIRQDLATMALSTLRHAETMLASILRMSNGNLSMEQTAAIYEHVLKPIGAAHETICQQFGIDHISGKPLLGTGITT